jgi:hypothetical protein
MSGYLDDEPDQDQFYNELGQPNTLNISEGDKYSASEHKHQPSSSSAVEIDDFNDDPVHNILQAHRNSLISLLHDLNSSIFNRKNLSEPQFFDMLTGAITRQMSESDTSFIEKFVQILHSKPTSLDCQKEWIKQKRVALSEHFEHFQEVACRFSELIISEKNLPNRSKLVPQAHLGGIAGGQKFLIRSLFI